MSKIKNGGLDQYGKVYALNGIGGKRVNLEHVSQSITRPQLHEVHTDTYDAVSLKREEAEADE